MPRDLTTKNDYVGVYFSNTIDLTRDFALTVGGRYNYAHIELEEQRARSEDPGEEDPLTGKHDYDRFNPMAGATYNLMPGSRSMAATRRRTARRRPPSSPAPIPRTRASSKASSPPTRR